MSTLYSSQTVVAAGGTSLLPTTLTLSKPMISLHAKVTSGTTVPTADKTFQIIVAATPYSLSTASAAPGALPPSQVLTCTPSQTASGVVYFKSEPFITEGLNLYAWVNADALGQAVTLDATVVEIA
jgi:hypothetical protein